MFEFLGCLVDVPAEQMSAIVRTESSANPYAVGIVGHKINRQPKDLHEAIELVTTLKDGGYNYSVGLAQVNQVNFDRYGLSSSNMFDKCSNLSAGSKILKACYDRYSDWSKAYSCYYSGNASTGFDHGYVAKVLANISKPILTDLFNPSSSSTSPITLTQRGSNNSTEIAPSLATRRLQSSLAKMVVTINPQNLETMKPARASDNSLSSRRLNSSIKGIVINENI